MQNGVLIFANGKLGTSLLQQYNKHGVLIHQTTKKNGKH